MVIKHDTTKREIELIRNAIKSVAEDINRLEKKSKDIEADTLLSVEGKADYQNRIKAEYSSKIAEIKENIFASLNNIAVAEKSNNEIFDITNSELQTALKFIDAVGDKIDSQTQKNITNSFKGNMQALTMLKSMYEAKGIKTDSMNKIMTDVESFVSAQKTKVEAFSDNITATTGAMQKLCDDLYNYADNVGITLSDDEKTTGLNLDNYYESVARSAMGL